MGFGASGKQTFTGTRGQEPRVTLKLRGQEVVQATRYQVKLGILSQPCGFSLTLADPNDFAAFWRRYPPNTPFTLEVDDRQMMTGRLDGRSSSGQTSELTVKGRDALAPLRDACLRQEDTYKDDTYANLVRKVMDSVGLKATELLFSNRKNRASLIGLDPERYAYKGAATVPALRQADTLAIREDQGGGAVKKHPQSQLGEQGYEFLKRHLDRSGLFLWSTADGKFVLSEPNARQVATYRIQRSATWERGFSDVLDHHIDEDTAGRFSDVSVYTRGETKRAGRSTTVATVNDSEMQALGYDRPRILRDVDADSAKKAEFMGRREMAKSRREGFKLSYTMAWHTTGSPLGGRVVWAPDTVVEVDDQWLGIQELFWIESVTFSSAPQASTIVELMRPRDLIFGDAPT